MNRTANAPDRTSWPWPFTLADLTAGLRRRFHDTSIAVREVEPVTMHARRPAIGRLRALRVVYQGRAGQDSCQLVVKEPRGTTRTGLAGAGRREVGVYQMLAPQLPMDTPALIAGSPSGDWLLLEAFHSAREPDQWQVEDYRQAVDALADLHDRFWGLGEDLAAFPWLSRPLEADFEVHVTAAAHAIERVVHDGQPEPLARAPQRMRVLARLVGEAERVVGPLRRQPATLLHGDYWPGNIASLQDGRQLVYDWQLAAVGPAVLDLLVFVNKSLWWFGDAMPLSAVDLIDRYRTILQARTGISWQEPVWLELWDHALMWRFLQEWVDLLAASPDPLLQTRAEQLDRVWLDPVAQAVARRLGEG